MNITSEEGSLEQYAIISYAHADTAIVETELKAFDKYGVCYWYDKEMRVSENYEKVFRKILDNKNCKGILFFISDSFFLSAPCAKEMRDFKDKYGVDNPDKFCLFILPEGYPFNGGEILERVNKYVENNKDNEKIQKKAEKITEDIRQEHIKLFSEVSQNGKVNYARIGKHNYINDGLFDDKGIMFGHKRVSNVPFGYFPQMLEEGASEDKESRKLDEKPAYYAPIEWLVIKDNEQTQTLLSKDLLFTIDYLDLKYPYPSKKNNKTLEEQIKDIFMKYFKPDEDKRKIKKIRFLSIKELRFLLRRNQKNPEKKHEILRPEATFFAQTSNIKNAPAFWLAGDINDAQWVDAATESLSEQKVGTELYYVRIVVDIEKEPIGEK